MASTTRTRIQPTVPEQSATLSWRTWPLVERRWWSGLMIAVLAGVGASVWYLGGGWFLAIVAAGGLAGTLWPFFLPVYYEVAVHGLRRRALGRTRLVPWHAIRAYQLRPTGVVLYQRSNPTKFDLLRSMFVPYPADADELLCVIRQFASHAADLST